MVYFCITMTALKSKAERTKEFITEKAAFLFNRKGYAGTSLNDLIEATQLTKGSLYGNFGNKEEIAVAAFEHNLLWIKEGLGQAFHQQEKQVDKLLALTQFYRSHYDRFATNGGCPLVNAGVEADDSLPFLHNKVKEEIINWINALDSIIQEGKATGEMKQEVPSNIYATLLITLIEGGILMANILGEPSPLFQALDKADTIIKTDISL